MKTIAFLGSGNMGGAMIHTVAEKGSDIARLRVYDKDIVKMNHICNKTGAIPCKDAKEAILEADIVFIAVKPNIVQELLEENKEYCKGKLIITIVAGVPVKKYTDLLGDDISIVRTIPNLPTMVAEGMTGIYFRNVSESDREYVIKLFDCFGKSVIVSKEDYIDEMIAVTSSSPAYICMFIEALADGAVRAGFNRDDAYTMALQTMYGTSKLLLEKKMHPAVLKDQICSPGGTTIEAVTSLEKTGLRNSVLEAMKAVSEKVSKLGKG